MPQRFRSRPTIARRGRRGPQFIGNMGAHAHELWELELTGAVEVQID
ncbi:hypothetical protein [Nannocystis radixulma]|uniref:Uncharacterized protein n=1 Tax=Nannocystis radixulma TaxID=2995305 RepID=A0ABT5B4N9_9BACT|nr:hypothetical protein [Nannocystis radixulma]MDC0668438.1 hypothetical protein [Nannocystis radixulma]